MGLRSASVLVLLAAGCAAGGEGIGEARLPELVLQPRDLPPVWVQFDEGRQIRADAPSGRRADASRFDRKGGWKARYRRPGSVATRGPLVIESRAELFETAAGAEDELKAHEAELGSVSPDAIGQRRLIRVPDLGEAAVASSLRQGARPPRVLFLTVAWRYRNVAASVVVNGFGGGVMLADAVALARKQQSRIERAADAG
jgi:hypothetical protein